jgi:hypothetical protein
MSNGTFDFNLFLKESKDCLLNPKSYFSTLKTSGGFTEPLIKAVIYGTIAGLFTLLWSLLKLSVAGSMFGGAIGLMALIWSIIGAVIALFIGAVILLVISAICKGNTDYEANARVTAALMVMMPISAFFGFAVGINSYLGMIIGLVINLYALWLMYYGLTETLKANPGTTKIVMYILIAITVIFMLVGMGTRNRINRVMKDYNKSTNELLKDIPRN